MTTIITDGKEIAADKQTTYGDVKSYTARKKIRKVGGVLYGIGGHLSITPLLWEWIEAGCTASEIPCEEGHEWEILRVSKRGVSTLTSDYWRWLASPRVAGIGTGGSYAEAAMLAGASVKEAVRIASKIDLYSGGGVVTLSL